MEIAITNTASITIPITIWATLTPVNYYKNTDINTIENKAVSSDTN